MLKYTQTCNMSIIFLTFFRLKRTRGALEWVCWGAPAWAAGRGCSIVLDFFFRFVFFSCTKDRNTMTSCQQKNNSIVNWQSPFSCLHAYMCNIFAARWTSSSIVTPSGPLIFFVHRHGAQEERSKGKSKGCSWKCRCRISSLKNVVFEWLFFRANCFQVIRISRQEWRIPNLLSTRSCTRS